MELKFGANYWHQISQALGTTVTPQHLELYGSCILIRGYRTVVATEL